MAKQEKQQVSNRLIGGMNMDVNPIDQPPNTYRFALNTVNNREVGAVSNEKGNYVVISITTGFEVIGSIVVNSAPADIKFVLFCVDESTGDSEIGRVSFDNTYTPLLNDSVQASNDKFNFSNRFPIEGEYKINATGEVSVYWTDDNNVPRYANINNLPIIPFGISLLDLFPKINKYPIINLDKVRSNGGALRAGSYQLTVAYMTRDGAITSYLDVSNPVYINDESEGVAKQATNSWGSTTLTTTEYNGCDGGTGTSKAIIWHVNNLDTNYKYILPCVVRTVDQAKDSVALDRVAIPQSGSVALVSYSGVEATKEELIGAVQIPKESYTKAKSVAQVDDVLYWGNLERDKIDIGYQKYANSIQIYSQEINDNHNLSNTLDITGFGNINVDFTKSFGVDAFDSSSFKGYKRGDVYAFYITWVMKDGSESVAYHIPGRGPLTSWRWYDGSGNFMEEDGILDVNVVNSGGTPHPFVSQLAYTSNKPFWYFHTDPAIAFNNAAVSRGFAFWQNQSELYPTAANDVDADGNYVGNFEVWSIDPLGFPFQLGGAAGSIQGLNVRHHHFPLPNPSPFGPLQDINQPANWNTTPILDQHAMNPMGIRINDVPIPSFCIDKCVAYKIYYLRKDMVNRVTVARGTVQGGRENNQEHFDAFGDAFICYPWQALDGCSGGGCIGGSIKYINTPFFTSNPLDLIQSGESIGSIDYIHQHYYGHTIFHDTNRSRGYSIWAKDVFGTSFAQKSSMHLSMDWVANNRIIKGIDYRVLKAKSRIPSGAILNATAFSRPVDNEGGTETIAFEAHDSIRFHNNNWESTGNWTSPYSSGWPTSNKINFDPFTGGPGEINMQRLEFEFMSFKTDVHLLYDKQTNFIYTGYAGVVDATLIPGGGTGYRDRHSANPSPPSGQFGVGEITMGGDTHIGYYSIDKYRKADNLDTSSPKHILGGGANNARTNVFNAGQTNTNDFYYDYAVHVTITEARHNTNMKHANDNTDAYYPAFDINHAALMNHENPGKGFGLYNLDFNTSNDTRLLRPFDPDDVLQMFTDYPTRIIRSIKYNQSGLEDNFRVYLPEDFRDLPRHRGELWKIKGYNNVIIPHMERSLYMTKGKEVLKMTDASEAYLGTGDLFEKDPAEALLTDMGHGGTGSQWAAITSEFGYFFVDKDAGRVFLIGEKLEEISMYGMRKFFLENLSTGSQLQSNQFILGLPNNFDNPLKGIGLTATYDPLLKRFILTKKDLRLSSMPSLVPLVYDTEKRWLYDSTGVPLTSADLEEYMEWTVSYDPTLKTWVSFHTYWPTLYISDLTVFHSYNGGTSIYEHGEGNPNNFAGNYYSESFPWFIDCIDNQSPDITKSYASISYTGDVIENLTGGIEVRDNPFTMIEVYNSYQESPYRITSGVWGQGRRTERAWYFNGFRDMSDIVGTAPITATPMMHNTGWAIPGMIGIASIPGTQTQRYMPSLNSNFINNNKTWDQQRKFTDKWLGIRLYNSNSTNNFVSLYTINAHKKISYR